MSKKKLIDAIEVKNPCSESWEEMHGNDQFRFCSHCAKSVNNLSEMTRREAVRLVRASGGNLCIRYIKHPKTGKPLFSENLYRITRRAPGLAAGVITATISLSTAAYAQGDAHIIIRPAAAAEKTNDDTRAARKPAGEAKGRIFGVVSDAHGAVIISAKILLINEGTNGVKEITSNDAGVYEFTGLAAGNYRMKFSAGGFATRDINGLTIQGDEVSNQDVRMDVAGPVSGGMIVVMPDIEHPLAAACQDDNIDEVKNLIGRGAGVNAKEKYRGITPLFIAVENGNKAIVEMLIRFGAKVNARDSEYRTPLMLLDDDADDGLAELLVRSGAKLDLTDNQGNTALIFAADGRELKTVRALIAAGARVNIQNKEGQTALMEAASDDSLEMVRALLLAGADVNLKNNEGETAWDLTGSPEVKELLESRGGTSGMPDEGESEDEGRSPSHPHRKSPDNGAVLV
jgi:ankyrin repeat protein